MFSVVSELAVDSVQKKIEKKKKRKSKKKKERKKNAVVASSILYPLTSDKAEYENKMNVRRTFYARNDVL